MKTAFFNAAALALCANLATADTDITFGMTTTQAASGLADALGEALRAEFPDYDFSYSISGTSQLLRSLEEGFLPFGITHNEGKEQALVAKGVHQRTPLFTNDFLFVGPEDSEITCDRVIDCLRALVDRDAAFLSRGDQSGTHAYEMALWSEAGIDPLMMENYQLASGGASNSLRICSIRGCHLVVDESSFSAGQSRGLKEIARDPGSNIYALVYASAFAQGETGELVKWIAQQVPELSQGFGYKAK